MTSSEDVEVPATRRRALDAIRSDRAYAEFLPAAVAISVRPVPPVVPILIAIVIAAVGAAIAWSALSTLDVFTSAAGRVRASLRPAVVQPMEAGRIADIRVHSGMNVEKGDVLIVLDSVEARAALDAATSSRLSWRAEIERRKSALEAVANNDFATASPAFSAEIPQRVAARETAAFDAELRTLRDGIGSLAAQIEEAKARHDRFAAVVAAERRLDDILKQKAGMAESLLSSAVGSKADALTAEENLARVEADLAGNLAQLKETDAGMLSLREQKRQAVSTFVGQQAQGIQTAERQVEQLDQEIVKQKARLDDTSLAAPVDGTVQQLAAVGPGQVVNPGQTLLVIVPKETKLVVEALIPSSDIGFVKVGDDVGIKADAFPFTRYGMFEGKVVTVSREAVTIRNAQALQDPISVASGRANEAPSGAPEVSGLYYIAMVALDDPSRTDSGNRLQLEPGMTVRAEIKTESRRVIDYILSPVTEVLKSAGHER